MNNSSAFQPISSLIDGCWPGEWGADPVADASNCVVYRATDIDDEGHLNLAGGAERFVTPSKVKIKSLRPNDIILEASGGSPDKPVGRVALVKSASRKPALTSNFFRFIRPKLHVDAQFLTFQLVALNRSSAIYRYQQQTTGLINLKVTDYLEHEIWAPSIAIQKQIAAILTSIDTAIEKTESLIAKYQKIKAGLMHDLFIRGVTADGKLRPPREQAPELYHETPVSWIPLEWQYEQLQIVLSKSGGYLQTGPFGSQLHADEYTDEGTPVVMPQDINNEMIELNSIARIPEHRANMLSRHRLKVGDITIARRGDLSRAAAVSEREANWICGTGCFLLRLGRTDLNHFFFSHAYRYDSIQRQIAGIAVGSTMPSLNNSVMSKLFFPVPMPSEQESISQRLDAMACKITSEQNKLEKLKKQKAGLMHDLLTGKVPVKINEPDQESA